MSTIDDLFNSTEDLEASKYKFDSTIDPTAYTEQGSAIDPTAYTEQDSAIAYTEQGSAIDPTAYTEQDSAIAYTEQGSAIDPTAYTEQDSAIAYTEQGSAIDPTAYTEQDSAIAYTEQGSAIDPTAYTEQDSAIAYTEQGSAIDPTAYTEQGSAIDPTATGYTVTAGGTEGSLIVLGNGTAIKRYKPGFKCNTKVLKKVKAMSGKGYVADLLDYGTRCFDSVECDYELMKHYPLGAASKYDLKGNADAILRIIVKIALCLNACHKKGFIHKDVKPANILITDTDTWDCVLCDFGFADLLENGKVSTIQNRTPIYAAPEVYDPENSAVIGGHTFCTLTAASDYYSLGMTALSLWSGEKAFLTREAELAIEKRSDKIKISSDIPNPLNKIIRGLLIKDPAHRWSIDEIRRTVEKKENVEVHTGGFEVVYDKSRGWIAHSVEELAHYMMCDHAMAKTYLYSGQISRWLDKLPELKFEINKIVEKDFPKNETTGLLCAVQILNPLYDLNINLPGKEGYAKTGKDIGRVLNDAYNLYYGKFYGDRNRVIKEWSKEDNKKVFGSAILLRIIASFETYSDNSYVSWFLRHKGSKFKDHLNWMKYCLDFNSKENRRKVGPKDPLYLEQTAMMKTIAGFGYTPTYDYDFNSQGVGVPGYLAVKYHENPKADLSEKFAYEKLLEQYLDEYRWYYPDANAVVRYNFARTVVDEVAQKIENGGGNFTILSLIQRICSIVFAAIPAIYLLISAIGLVIKYPEVDVSGINFGWTFAVIGLILGIVGSALCDIDGVIYPVISGLLLGFVLFIIVKLLGAYIFWIYTTVIIALVVLFVFKVIFVGRLKRTEKVKHKAGYRELHLEPLNYAFNSEKIFNSSLHAYVDNGTRDQNKSTLKSRFLTLLVFTAIIWTFIVGQYYINNHTDGTGEPESNIQIVKRQRGIINE